MLTDSNLFLIELLFKCTKKKFLGCLDFVFFLRKKKRDFHNFYDFYLYFPKYLGISYLKIWNLIQFQDYFYLNLHFLEKFYIKLAYLEQEENYQLKSYYLVNIQDASLVNIQDARHSRHSNRSNRNQPIGYYRKPSDW